MEKEAQNNVVHVNFSHKDNKASHSHSKAELSLKEGDKLPLFSQWIIEGTVCVLLDARHDGVKVPVAYKNQGDLRLNFSYQFHIADFNFNQNAVFATLSFDDGEFFCFIPWDAVYAIQSSTLNNIYIWFNSFPDDYDFKQVLGVSKKVYEHFLLNSQESITKYSHNNIIKMNLTDDIDKKL